MLAGAVAVPLALFCLAAWQSFKATVAAAETRVERTARILEEHADKVFDTQRLVIEAINERLRVLDRSSPAALVDFQRFIAHFQTEFDQITTVAVTDAAGHTLANSHRATPDPTVSYIDRDWFQALSRAPVTMPFVSKAYPGRITGEPIFNLADRTPPGPNGGFGGVVAISVDRGYLERFYASAEPNYDYGVLLVRDDGEILAAVPQTKLTQLRPYSTLLADMHRGVEGGTYQYRSNLDGIDRFLAFRKVGAYPVYVRFGISRSAALAPWRATIKIYGVVAALTSLLLVAASSLALRQTRRWRDVAAALEREGRERARVEMQMRQMQKMEAVGQLTGGIAHDFNNMLAVIIGGLNLVQRRLDRGETDVGRFVDAAMDGATRAATLTQRLLAFSRQQPLKPAPLAPNDLVAGMSELLRRTIGETVRLETVLAGGLWRTEVDAVELENALLNLAVNARDAMPDGGKLTIETANARLDEDYAAEHDVKPGQYVMLAVTDTGTGMAADVAARAFDPFFTTKPVGKGTGLGLSQVYGFVKQSAGHIKIYSEPGHGTTFKIYLARMQGDARVAQRGGGRSSARPVGPAYRQPTGQVGRAGEIILVVEDEDRVRTVSVEALRDLGFTVLHASGGERALDLLRAHPSVDLLFTDVVMPGMSGRQLAAAAAAERPDLKVLFATGYTRNAISHNGALDPGVELISKPFSMEQLALKVRSLLDAR